MRIRKKVLAQLNMVYAISTLRIDGRIHLLAATEIEDECLLFSPPDWKPSVVWSGPGGAMCLLPIREKERAFFAIQKFFLIYRAKEACIVFAQARDKLSDPWSVKQIINLPYAHRIAAVKVGSIPFLIAATLCGGKDFQEDWSKPGAVYACPIAEDYEQPWSLSPIYEGITKNHGLHITEMNGKQVLLVGGSEGLFRFNVPAMPDGQWNEERLIDHEVSDMFVSDLDDDGLPEIVTIEPFHGNELVIYKELSKQWNPVARKQLHYGHVVWAGRIGGSSCIVTGSRSGPKNLELLHLEEAALLTEGKAVLRAQVIDSGVGPTQVAVVSEKKRDLIFSANHAVSEVAMYELT